MFYGAITTGILTTALFGTFIDKDILADNASYFLVIPIIMTVLRILLLLFVFNVESPVYIIEKYAKRTGQENSNFTDTLDVEGGQNFTLDNKHWEKIEKTLSKIYTPDSVSIVKNKLIKELDGQFGREEITFKELFSVYYRKKLFIGIVLNWFQQFNGINFFIIYATDAFNNLEAGSGDTINLVGAFVNFFSFIPTIYFSNKFGRRFNLLSGIGAQFIAYIVMVICVLVNAPVWVQSIPVMFTFLGFGVGMGGTVFLYMSEYLPTIGLGLCLFWQWIVTS